MTPKIDIITQWLADHIDDADRRFSCISESIRSIKENHLQHIERDLSKLQIDVSKNTENIEWIKRIQWFLITTSALTLIGIVINTYFTLR